MNIISVQASQSYDILIGTNLLKQAGTYIKKVCSGKKAAIISDSNVWPLYGAEVRKSLQSENIECVNFVFPAGEESKNSDTYLRILNFLAESQITRSDLLIALGGGVVGDITGFAAATYLRGLAYIQIPTSLLAMVDSSVGGKTAIDLPAGKNLVGAFKQPKLVLCDVDTLSSLPQRQFLDGCAEVIKYGMLYDAALVHDLLRTGPDFDREAVIAKCVAFKRDVVQQDEFDKGERQKLNLGHTIGHGIEAGSNFSITHGQAVAAGMAIVTRSAVKEGLCAAEAADILCDVLQRFSLPVDTNFSANALFHAALSDKKRDGSMVNLIVPTSIGCCEIVATPVAKLESFIEAGL